MSCGGIAANLKPCETLGEAWKVLWDAIGLNVAIGPLYRTLFERDAPGECAVLTDARGRGADQAVNSPGYDVITKTVYVLSTDPMRAQGNARKVFDAFHKRPQDFPIVGLFGCRATSAREAPVKESRLPNPDGRQWFQSTVEFELKLSRPRRQRIPSEVISE